MSEIITAALRLDEIFPGENNKFSLDAVPSGTLFDMRKGVIDVPDGRTYRRVAPGYWRWVLRADHSTP